MFSVGAFIFGLKLFLLNRESFCLVLIASAVLSKGFLRNEKVFLRNEKVFLRN
jgi:hypothetical protein